ncbi:hypothetical protein ACFVWY_22205 [Streptomyces sp. NPDC058195]|uniref:hypothetical protein n=1 Tax=Streptomyces sp. NPDC058195 TaxID=3346375 RepID=UPI0036EF33C7
MTVEGFDAIYSLITDRLSGEDWRQTTRSKDSSVPEFVMENGCMRTVIFQIVDEKSLTLTLMNTEEDSYLRFEIGYENRVSTLLDILIRWGGSVTPESFHAMINEIAKEFPDTLAEPLEGDEDTPWLRVIPSA